MPGLRLFKTSFYSNIGANEPIPLETIKLGSTKGIGSSTRIFNWCKQHSPNPSLCINQFISVTNTNNNNNNNCNLLPKDTPYQLCSPWPQFGGLDNTNSRYTPILGSQTGISKVLYTSDSGQLFQASTSPAIASDGTIYVGYNTVDTINEIGNSYVQGFLVAFNSNGSIKWTFSLPQPDSNNIQSYFNGSTPTIGLDGTIYFGIVTDNGGGYGLKGPVGSTSVYAINPDGTLKWVRNNIVPFNAPQPPLNNGSNSVSITASLVIGSDNNLYFGCSASSSLTPQQSSSLFSLDSKTGTTNWEYPLSYAPNSLTISTIYDSVAIDNNNNIYFICQKNVYNNNLVYLISLTSNGNFRYICDLNNGNTNNIVSYGRPVLSVDNSNVYAISIYNRNSLLLYSINAQTGSSSLIQSISVNNYFNLTNSMARDNQNNLYFSTTDLTYNGVLYSVNNNGSINWTYTINAPSNSYVLIDCTPAISSDGTIYFGVLISDFNTIYDYHMYALNNNGTLKWSKLLSTNAYIFSTSPSINLQGNLIMTVLTGNYHSQTAGSIMYSFS